LHALGKGDVLCAGEHVGLLDLVVDDGGGVIGHLAAVGAVCLVAVVLGGVVGRGDHDARVAVVVPGGEAQGRHRHQGVVDADLDAVGSQDAGGRLGKDVALDAAVVADGDGLAAALGLDPVGQPLGCLTDDVDIHAVGAGAQHAAQAGVPNFSATAKRSLISASFPSIFASSGLRSASSRSAAIQRLYSSRYIVNTLPLL